jgi:hypothetical protein
MIFHEEIFNISENSYAIIGSESGRRYQVTLLRQTDIEDSIEEKRLEIFVVQ